MKTSEVEIRNKHTYGTRTVTVLTSSYTICLFVATDIIQKKKRKRKKKRSILANVPLSSPETM